MGSAMVMGRKTFESLPGLLPGRRHIVMTRDPNWAAAGTEVAHDVDAALALAGDEPRVGDWRGGDLRPVRAARRPHRADRSAGRDRGRRDDARPAIERALARGVVRGSPGDGRRPRRGARSRWCAPSASPRCLLAKARRRSTCSRSTPSTASAISVPLPRAKPADAIVDDELRPCRRLGRLDVHHAAGALEQQRAEPAGQHDALAGLVISDAHMLDPAAAVEPLAPAAAGAKLEREPRRVARISVVLRPPRPDLAEGGERLRGRDGQVERVAQFEAVAARRRRRPRWRGPIAASMTGMRKVRMAMLPRLDCGAMLAMTESACLAVEDRVDRRGDLADRGHAVDAADEALFLVEREDRRGLGAIFGHARAHGLLIVVGAALEFGRRRRCRTCPASTGHVEGVVIGRAALAQVKRPVMRSTSASSSTTSSMTWSSLRPRSPSRISSASAWCAVRGKPSKIAPCAAAVSSRSPISAETIASETSSPASITALARMPDRACRWRRLRAACRRSTAGPCRAWPGGAGPACPCPRRGVQEE